MKWFDRHRNERGAIAVMMAVVICFVLIPLAAFTVDLGTQRIARKDMQAVADTVALDMARELSNAPSTGITDATLTADAKTSAKQDRGAVGLALDADGDPKVTARQGYVDPSKFKADQSLGCGVSSDEEIDNGYFSTNVSDEHKADAVLVTVSGSVNFMIHGGSGTVCRSAVATAKLDACMQMDSYAAALHSGNSAVLGVLNKILGTTIDTTALGSSGILTTDLDALSFLNILKTQLGVGTFSDVLAANVSAAQILAAEVAALNAQGATAAAQVLQQQIAAHLPPGTQINVGDLLGVSQGGDDGGLSSTLNPLDLAAAAVQLANGTSAVSVGLSSSNLTGLSATVNIGTHPTRVCLGDGKKSTGQSSIEATADINAPGSLTAAIGNLVNGLTGLLSGVLNLLGGLLGGDTYDIPTVTLGTIDAKVSLASVSGEVTGVNCDGGVPQSIAVRESASLAPATISIPIIVKETRHYGGVLGIGRKQETVTSTLTIVLSTDSPDDKSVAATLEVPDDYGKAVPGPDSDLSVDSLSETTHFDTDGSFSNGWPLFNKLLSSVDSVLQLVENNLLSPLESTVLTPLLNTLTSTLKSTLGLTAAGSTFTPLPTPSCDTPNLVG